VLVSGGQKIYLEDADSCPADCGGTGTSWTWIIAILLLCIICYYYFGGMYQGPGNFQDLSWPSLLPPSLDSKHSEFPLNSSFESQRMNSRSPKKREDFKTFFQRKMQ